MSELDHWFYLGPQGEQHGPVDRTELLGLWRSGELGAETLVWCPGQATWTALSEAMPAYFPPAPPGNVTPARHSRPSPLPTGMGTTQTGDSEAVGSQETLPGERPTLLLLGCLLGACVLISFFMRYGLGNGVNLVGHPRLLSVAIAEALGGALVPFAIGAWFFYKRSVRRGFQVGAGLTALFSLGLLLQRMGL